jgi:hypothetical protein
MTKTIESKLFDWKSVEDDPESGWDLIDTACFVFYKPILKVPIGEHKIGEKIGQIVIDYQNSIISVSNNGGKTEEVYELQLVIGKKVK